VLLFCDSFDHYDTAHMGEKYLTVNGVSIASGGREGGNCLSIPRNTLISKALPNSNELIVGFAFNPSEILPVDSDILQFFDASNLQGALRLNSANGLDYYTYPGGHETLIATSDVGIVNLGTYQYIEIKVLFSTASTGSITLQMNGGNIYTVTGIQTSSTSNNYANVITFEFEINGNFSSAVFSLDDLYVCDGTGTVNNDFLGDVGVELLLPNGDGTVNDFSQVGGTSGENYTSVNEVPPDDDSSYVYSSNPGDVDTYTLASVGSPSAIVGVQIVASARKDDSYTRVLGLGFSDGTSYAFNDGDSLTSDYQMYTQPFDQNPITSADWTISDLDDGELAIKVIS